MNPPRKFAWSWSRLKNYRSCPKRHYHIEIAKDIVEPESEALKWGHSFHEAMAKRIETGKLLPKDFVRHDHWPELLYKTKQRGVVVKTELQMALNEQLQPTDWFGKDTWFRGVIDVLALDTEYAVIVDWKTGGKIQPELEQLGLFAQLIFSYYDIETVHTAYQWSQFDDVTLTTYHKGDMVKLWNHLLPEVKQMEQAAKNMDYPPKPSGLCVRHCPVVNCIYYGRGSRTA